MALAANDRPPMRLLSSRGIHLAYRVLIAGKAQDWKQSCSYCDRCVHSTYLSKTHEDSDNEDNPPVRMDRCRRCQDGRDCRYYATNSENVPSTEEVGYDSSRDVGEEVADVEGPQHQVHLVVVPSELSTLKREERHVLDLSV